MKIPFNLYWCRLLAWLERRPHALWAAPFISFLALAAIVFSHYSKTLFYRFDGSFILTMATTQRKWMAPSPGLSLNFLESLGDIWIPIATNWSVGFSIGGLFGHSTMPVVACLVFAVEFYLSTLVLARCIGAGRLRPAARCRHRPVRVSRRSLRRLPTRLRALRRAAVVRRSR
jgi:hypothetical protein